MNFKHFPKILLMLGVAFSATQCQSDTADTGGSNDLQRPKMGAEVLVESNFAILDGKNVGVVTNHSAMVGDEHLVDLLHAAENVNLVALFGPEHGIRGDDVGHITDAVDEKTGLPAYSLYGDIRQPTAEMMEGIDILVFDIQDIGPRFYTYISTMGLTMQTAAQHGIPYVVLDRPNPLGGRLVEGFMLDREYESFAGFFDIPVTHGLTVGEVALMAKAQGMVEGIENLDLHVIKMEGWDRDKLWSDYPGLGWIKPSPNIPDFETALIYPGACFFEGITPNEGRGTQEPFILLGAPWIDADALAADMNARNLPGLRFEAATYTPVPLQGMTRNPKFNGQEIYGIRHVVTDAHAVRPVETGIHLVHAFYTHTEGEEKATFFRPYIAQLAGTTRLQTMLEEGKSAEEIIASWQNELAAYDQMRKAYFLYD